MKNAAIINAIQLDKRALKPLIDGESSLKRAVSFGRKLPGVGEVVILATEALEGFPGATIDRRDAWSLDDLLSSFKKHGDGSRDMFYFFGDCPLLDLGISERMHAHHGKYFADYTFADGYPFGLAPEIIRTDIVERLVAIAQGLKGGAGPASGREALFDLISKDINSFDVETELAPADQRMLRVSLTADTARNFLLLGRLIEAGAKDAETATRILDERPKMRRTLPAFFPIQIVERCPQACSYCPYPLFGGNVLEKNGAMTEETFAGIVKRISEFASDAVVDISLWGEPSLHPRIFEIVKTALARPGIDLVIETSGIGWDKKVIERISKELPRSPTWIVSCDALTADMYAKLRGEGFEESRKTAELLFGLFPRTTYVQAVRMKENEEDLDGFYKSWKDRTENIIVQKYDSFSGFLPERKVADLSPLKRFCCWHLLRDFPILLDGSVPMCREDVEGVHTLGNVHSSSLEEIWEKADVHLRHMSGDYPKICAACDEWYTYNF
jgi:spiro-SPASM protein